jgi:hypothetical protein
MFYTKAGHFLLEQKLLSCISPHIIQKKMPITLKWPATPSPVRGMEGN